MTPFGMKVRDLRKQNAITLKKMAEDLGVSSAYFSALEHGHRSRPGSGLVQQICGYFDLMWDDAEELRRLAELSHPRIVVNTAGLTPKATELANTLATQIKNMDEDTIEWILAEIRGRHAPLKGPTH
ncbi:MAG: helix-turn-helix transcriptional regulator [Rhodospirillaceae bacterium]|nr:helix-turn-helix transcriptional regulator [Rhodospirillaceae bacterium]MBT3910855.1 helix-turn-helix transcriptional regulator [Rhodospirillaceae bacterium]MBT5514229.1 helix-turn-helix transcriptional regulator [Rhodospirillaceae bacterium]MBT6084551.1 helix-turn-helix transcriptional regulator [Rhodospirillaceae bacterium]MBT6608036.1 helix-turn-helix transcriptional regulator [Rhodospirillaceae bacterium]